MANPIIVKNDLKTTASASANATSITPPEAVSLNDIK